MPLIRVGIVAGEISGDLLGAGMIRELKALNPDIEFIGVGGEQMASEGLSQLYDMERLAVMGLIEPLKRLPELLKMRSDLAKHFIAQKIDLFIGIDAPDFNLGLAKKLKHKGIKTLHYVSPSVWAWRQGRIKSICKSVDMMLTLLPFEAAFYEKHQVPVRFVGHPLATNLLTKQDKVVARSLLDLDAESLTIALLPGSRSGEIKHLMPIYLEAIEQITQVKKGIDFVFAAVNEAKADQIKVAIQKAGSSCDMNSCIQIITAKTQDVIASADLVLAASGTTTLEIMLINRPMVVAYRTDGFTYRIINSMLKVPYVSLPNLIAGKALVSEYLQQNATADKLSAAVLDLLDNPEARQQQTNSFAAMSEQLKLPSDKLAAEAAFALISDV